MLPKTSLNKFQKYLASQKLYKITRGSQKVNLDRYLFNYKDIKSIDTDGEIKKIYSPTYDEKYPKRNLESFSTTLFIEKIKTWE